MKVLLYISAALVAYLVAGWNPAITFSKAIYNKDIRTCGSGNPGFTNFKRSFGNKWAWYVLLLDLSKAAVVVVFFARIFGEYYSAFQFGAAYTGWFALLGHAFPVWYGFKGGKGFLVNMSVIWIIDWRVGAIALSIMLSLLFATKYMSFSTVVAMLACPIFLMFFNARTSVVLIHTVSVILMAIRHKENIRRLWNGTESKFEVKAR